MSFDTSSLASTTFSNIRANWPAKWQPLSDNGARILHAIANAFAQGFATSLRSAVITGGTITGGVAPPGGPVVGAVLQLAPGGLQFQALGFSNYYIPPLFSVTDKQTSIVSSSSTYTTWHKALVNTTSSVLDESLAAWITTWLFSSGIAQGGIAAWIPPIPPAPPVPGPWANGTIVPFLFVDPAGGTNASPALADFPTLVHSRAMATQVQVQEDGTRRVVTELEVQTSRPFLAAVANGILTTIDSTFAQMFVKDPVVPGSAFGTAFPPAGSIIGSIPTLVFDVI